ncbi:MAG: hypothetical protein AAFX80_23935 [Cyanobacteria bacterium J06639_18]
MMLSGSAVPSTRTSPTSVASTTSSTSIGVVIVGVAGGVLSNDHSAP